MGSSSLPVNNKKAGKQMTASKTMHWQVLQTSLVNRKHTELRRPPTLRELRVIPLGDPLLHFFSIGLKVPCTPSTAVTGSLSLTTRNGENLGWLW